MDVWSHPLWMDLLGSQRRIIFLFWGELIVILVIMEMDWNYGDMFVGQASHPNSLQHVPRLSFGPYEEV